MSAKKFGSVTPSANTDTDVFTVTDGKSVIMNIHIANKNGASVQVWITIGDDVIEPGGTINANGTMEYTGVIAVGNETVSVKASSEDVVFRITGMEK